MSAAVQDTFVLSLTGDDVLLRPGPFIEPRNTFYTHVIAFGGPARKDDFLWISTNEVCDMCSSFFNGFLGFPAVRVGSRMRISVNATVERKHGIQDSWVCRGRGLHVEVDGSGSLIHDGCVFENSCSWISTSPPNPSPTMLHTCRGTHHCVSTYTRRWQSHVAWLDACLLREGFLFCAYRIFDMNCGFCWPGCRYVRPSRSFARPYRR
jgi:hypothetical protein